MDPPSRGEGPLTGGFPCQMAIFPGSLVGAFDRGIPCQMVEKVVPECAGPPNSIQLLSEKSESARGTPSATSAVADLFFWYGAV